MKAVSEIEAGRRFGFGKNWSQFLVELSDERIAAAEASLREMLCVEDLNERRFLDIGSGSGLFSLAARRLGANVHSFDFDPRSVTCTQDLKRRFYPGDENWRIEEGSILDSSFVESVGTFDVVYSWGVLHHTGAMWLAIEHAISCVRDDGRLYIAIYNDQGWRSHAWWLIKAVYNKLPSWMKPIFVTTMMALARVMAVSRQIVKLDAKAVMARIRRRKPERGMSSRHDDIDWIGGFPYEFAEYDLLEDYFRARGFVVINSRRNDSSGCSELVLSRS